MTQPSLESVAKVLVINEKNEVLILTVGEYKERPDKSFKPDLPGGLVDPGESELEAVVRELQEESGIEVERNMFELVYAKTEFYPQENKSVSKFLYILRLTFTPDVTISWEHASYEWVPLTDLQNSIELRSFYKEAVAYCFTNNLLSTEISAR